MTLKHQEQHSVAQPPRCQLHAPHLPPAASAGLPARAPRSGRTARAAAFLPRSAAARARVVTSLAVLPALLQLLWRHRTVSPRHGLPPRGSEPSGQNTCSLRTLGSRSGGAAGGRLPAPGSRLGVPARRSPALLLLCRLLTPCWVCSWPGSAAEAACRSAQAGRGGRPAAGRARGQGGPLQRLRAPPTPARPQGRRRGAPGASRVAPGAVRRQPALQTEQSSSESCGSGAGRAVRTAGAPGSAPWSRAVEGREAFPRWAEAARGRRTRATSSGPAGALRGVL